jgi:hypothetical protein
LTKIKTKAKDKVLLNLPPMKPIVLTKGAHLSKWQCDNTFSFINVYKTEIKTLTKIKTKAKDKVLLNIPQMKPIVLTKEAHLSKWQCNKTFFFINEAVDQ